VVSGSRLFERADRTKAVVCPVEAAMLFVYPTAVLLIALAMLLAFSVVTPMSSKEAEVSATVGDFEDVP
jgi:hypothetical protein